MIRFRELCRRCLQPLSSCYCALIQPFESEIKFVVLIHPIERKRRIATGRMSHLCLTNSELIEAEEYSKNTRVERLLSDSSYSGFVLYPGEHAIDVGAPDQRAKVFAAQKKVLIFVIDGTWATAKKTMRQSPNLLSLPRIAFTPRHPSRFLVRKQPHPNCFSTIEAIHETIERLAPPPDRGHDILLKVFDSMVQRQLAFVQKYARSGRSRHEHPASC